MTEKKTGKRTQTAAKKSTKEKAKPSAKAKKMEREMFQAVRLETIPTSDWHS